MWLFWLSLGGAIMWLVIRSEEAIREHREKRLAEKANPGKAVQCDGEDCYGAYVVGRAEDDIMYGDLVTFHPESGRLRKVRC